MSFKSILILTGAGASADSGLKTFRDSNGLWENHKVTDVATPEAFQRDPNLVQRFYNLRREQLKEVEPNAAHRALAHLEKEFGGDVRIITQNVDDLHERAGSENVLHMHGELRKIRNMQTGEIKHFEGSIQEEDYHTWRPHIVWFGESILESAHIQKWLNEADLFISIGTSAQVYPAAGFVDYLYSLRVKVVELNLEKTSKVFDLSIQGKAKDIVPEFVDRILSDTDIFI